MDFSYTEEQTLLRNSVQSFLAGRYDFDSRLKVLDTDVGWRPEVWQEMAELGLLAVPFSEEQGGIDGGPVENMILMQEFGRHLVVEPYVETVVMAGGYLRDNGSDKQQEEHIAGIIGGEHVWAVAWTEPAGRNNPAWVETSAKGGKDGYVIDGHKAMVSAAPWADKLLVTARTSGKAGDRDGISVFIVDKGANGVTCKDYRTTDGRRASEITFKGVKVGSDALVGKEGKALPAVEKMLDEGIGAICAEAVGCMKAMNEATIEYTRTRKQFDVPIAAFQVLQHRMVDMFIATELAVSMTYRVNLLLGSDEDERARAASGAKAQICKSARFVRQEAVQLHGGIGVTYELNVGHYFKRLTAIDTQFGNFDDHLRRYSRHAA